MFWGFSEAINLYEEFKKQFPNSNTKEVNILLFGACDPRNILQTIAKKYNYPDVKLNFYILDGCIEILARQMLLLCIALENPEYLTLKTKTNLFIDIYGNSLIRPFSFNYIAAKSSALRKCVTDDDYLEQCCPIFNIENLKYRERDGLEETFNFWLSKVNHIFDISKYWEQRVRKALGTRYDYRVGAFDWDLQINLKDAGATQICCQEYKYWRETGIAFTFPEFENSKANKTLAAGLVRNGPNYRHRGYVGDMETGPFCTFGLKTSSEKMLKSQFGNNDYRATDITERNILELLFEIQEQVEYQHDDKDIHKLGSTYPTVIES